jgi:hypothetical protein
VRKQTVTGKALQVFQITPKNHKSVKVRPADLKVNLNAIACSHRAGPISDT